MEPGPGGREARGIGKGKAAGAGGRGPGGSSLGKAGAGGREAPPEVRCRDLDRRSPPTFPEGSGARPGQPQTSLAPEPAGRAAPGRGGPGDAARRPAKEEPPGRGEAPQRQRGGPTRPGPKNKVPDQVFFVR